MAGAYKNGKGWVDQTKVKAWFFFFKIDKRWGDHITSLTGFGAPQTHTQRSYKRSIAAYDTAYSKEQGVSTEDFPTINDQGIGYSQHAGQVIVADGTPEAAIRLERVLTTDPGMGVVRHADAGYQIAIEAAKKHGIKIPMLD